MTEPTVEARIAQLERKLTEPTRRKDPWDKFQIVAALLIPAAIAFAGFQFSRATSAAQIESAGRLAELSRSIQIIDARVKQATLVSAFMEPLLSADPLRKRLAIRAVLIALPDDGPALVSEISDSDPNPAVKQFAATQLSDRRQQLIAGLFADDASLRTSAAGDLVRGWRSDHEVVRLLVNFAEQHMDNANGVYNTIVVLSELDPAGVAAQRNVVLPFLKKAEGNGQRTAQRSVALQRRLDAGA
jgi:hypothetical protein